MVPFSQILSPPSWRYASAYKPRYWSVIQNLLVLIILVFPVTATASNIFVTDGDTIHVDSKIYRLEGIDAPETKQSCMNAKGKIFRCGLIATKLMRQLVISGNVQCVSSSQDRYGRNLGHCSSNGIDINQAMVELGYARAFVKYSGEFIADEIEAQNAKRGLWAGQWQAPWDWRAAQLAANDVGSNGCVIKGNIGKKGKVYYMPFHAAYRRVKIDRNRGEHWFCTEDEAIQAGWRRTD